ncbi:MAG TPA: hypothetical protein VGD49_13420 [Longimicrobiales bacterium]
MKKGMKFALVAAGTMAIGACNGWPDAIEYNTAANKPEKYVTYTATPADSVPMFVAEHHRYMIMPGRTHMRLGRTHQVGSTSGSSVFALEGEEAPYAYLFAQTPNGEWRSAMLID